ncbi:Fic family protein [Candidatus Woesearchaeota archaeon]|nr:Fic family protein [Candidatus Woesearchaeota archaeon]
MTRDMISRIDETVERINSHPEYSRKLRYKGYNTLLCEASRHSVSMELDLSNSKGTKNKLRADLRNLKAAWDYLCGKGISLSSIARLGNLVEPEINKVPQFRNTAVQFGPFSPPVGYENIARLVLDLVAFLNKEQLHPVSRSIEAHIELVRIHPYIDGNGRAARLLQSYFLEEHSYPPALILPSERELYIGLLERTLNGRYNLETSFERPSDNEVLFRKFLESKILGSALRLEEDLKTHRFYQITLKNLDGFGVVRCVANILRTYGRSNGCGIKVKVFNPLKSKRIQYLLEVEGDLSRASLLGLIKRSSVKYDFNYEITTVRD